MRKLSPAITHVILSLWYVREFFALWIILLVALRRPPMAIVWGILVFFIFVSVMSLFIYYINRNRESSVSITNTDLENIEVENVHVSRVNNKSTAKSLANSLANAWRQHDHKSTR